MIGLKRLLLLTIVVLPLSIVRAGSNEPALVINEIMTANVDMFMDKSFNYGSWIELYNPSTTDINISGWYLSNDPTNSKQYSLGTYSRVVKAGGFLTLWFGHQEDYCMQQIDLNLDYDGGIISLADKDGKTVCSAEYSTIPARISWARKTDGADEWGFTATPTPDATNAGSQFATQQLEAPQVNVNSKLFTESFSITITIPDGATLYYTEDGSTPFTTNKSTKTGSGKFTVSETKIYRFRLYKDGMLPSPVTTRSYIHTSNNYQVPVVSIVTDHEGLYSSRYGLWEKGPYGLAGNGQAELCNWNRDWDRPANIEIIDPSNEMIINQEVDICNAGRYSRAFEPHSLKIEAKKKFGYQNYFDFTPFKEKPYNKNKTLKIRNGGNSNQARFRDAAIQQILIRSGVNLECQSYQPIHQYINGVYKGVLNLREPNNNDYAYANYGIEDDEVDFFKIDHNLGNSGHGYGYYQTKGTSDAWDEWFELSKTAANPDSYKKICQLVDVEEFANYMAIELLLYNSDWPINNVKAFRRRPDGQFRFILFDIDIILGVGYGSNSSDDPFTVFDSKEDRSVLVTLFHNMLANTTFNRLFVNTCCIMAGSVLKSDNIKPIINELAAVATREMAFNNESPSSDINMILNNLTDNYLTTRISQLNSWRYIKSSLFSPTKTLSSNLPLARITIDGVLVPTGKFKGKILTEATVDVSAPYGYTFEGWKNSTGKIISTSPRYKMKVSMNENLTAWFIPNDSILPVRINEVSAGNGIFINDSFKKHDWLELYNVTDEPYDASGMYLSDNPNKPHKYTIPQGTIIPAHDFLVIWCDNEDGSQLHANFKLSNKEVSAVILTAKDDSWTDTFTYRPHHEYQTIGLYPDGGNSSYVFNCPSIGKKNTLIKIDSLYNKTTVTSVAQITTTPDLKQEQIYNLLGQPVQEMQPGQMYIRNGKKYYYRP